MLDIVIPMAGEGRRFAEAGYLEPKPLIDVNGAPMVSRVVDCLTPREPHRFHLLDQEKVGKTAGAVDTILKGGIFNGETLLANCDQYLSCSIDDFLADARGEGLLVGPSDASVMVFNSTNPHHSYVKICRGFVTEIVEKRVISDNAVVGVYWFARGLTDYAEKVVAADARHAGEFYVSAILAAMVADGLRVRAYEVDVHAKHMLGTPEELRIFLDKVADGRVVL